MVSVLSLLLLGFFLGMRHATDPDHVVAVTTIVSRERTLRAAAPLGAIWGLGHTLTILLVGGAIVLFGIVVPPRVGLTMEFSVALMLMLLGGLSLARIVRQTRDHDAAAPDSGHERAHAVLFGLDRRLGRFGAYRFVRPLVVGVVHGMAGSAAVALLVVGTIHDPGWALVYLVVFGAGTIAGMLLITTALAIPFAYVARRFERLHRGLGLAAGVSSLAFGALLAYEIGFVQGLFTGNPQWVPG
ncbi:high-affinity nickel-transport family protein [Polyangium sorediatum]|uniref:Nickel/cobalt efflux system n=1 Tax=Polyangium sorediatum TaxID=889274 RepID=A0ABT6NMF3_9BACT|nr:high-affinity nickel-transport family protein [Polyangium sorediatum]MDI1429502.1 high-affinity nickel-transport family protein [Polyangium sorediatum]